MIKRLTILALCLIPAVVWSQTKPKKITTYSDDPHVRKLATEVDRAFDESYLRLRTNKNLLTATQRVDTDTIKNESASFLMLMPRLGGVYIRPSLDGVVDNYAELRLYEDRGNGTGYSGFRSLASLINTSVSWTLPDGDGTANRVMVTDASGGLNWNTTIDTDVLLADSVMSPGSHPASGASSVLLLGAGDHVSIKSYREVAGIDVPGEIRLYEDTSRGDHSFGIKAPDDLSASILYQLPNSAGAVGQVLVAPGGATGELTWADNYNWAKTGDTLFQNVYDTVISSTATTFTLPISYTSATSYRVSCTATDNTSPNINYSASNGGQANVWGMIRIRQTSGSTFNVSLIGYTDQSANQWNPGAGDSLTCNCVASGR